MKTIFHVLKMKSSTYMYCMYVLKSDLYVLIFLKDYCIIPPSCDVFIRENKKAQSYRRHFSKNDPQKHQSHMT